MYIKRNPIIYPNPQPSPRDLQNQNVYGFEQVVESLRRIKLLPGFVIISEQEVVDDRRILSWRVGNISDQHCMVISYNFTLDHGWFQIMDTPTCVLDEPIVESMFERGQEIHGPNGAYSFDESSVLVVLEDIENTAQHMYS